MRWRGVDLALSFATLTTSYARPYDVENDWDDWLDAGRSAHVSKRLSRVNLFMIFSLNFIHDLLWHRYIYMFAVGFWNDAEINRNGTSKDSRWDFFLSIGVGARRRWVHHEGEAASASGSGGMMSCFTSSSSSSPDWCTRMVLVSEWYKEMWTYCLTQCRIRQWIALLRIAEGS